MAKPKAELVKATVAKGRTVAIGEKAFGPGSVLSLPAEEVEHLRARGFLADSDAPEIPRGNGPQFTPAVPRPMIRPA